MAGQRDGQYPETSRRTFLKAGVSAAAGAALSKDWLRAQSQNPPASPATVNLEEITLESMRIGLSSGQFTARSLTQYYLSRIATIDQTGPRLNSVIETNPDALTIAEDLDRERRARGPRSALHGIPVLIKDNIATRDRMQTTAGSLALIGSRPP